MKVKFLPLLLAIVCSACGRTSLQRTGTQSQTPISFPVIPIVDASPLPSPSPVECTLPLVARAELVSVAPYRINEDIRVRVIATRCPGDLFKVANQPNIPSFGASIELVKRYVQPGNNSEAFVVEAYSAGNNAVLKATAVATFTIAVTAPNVEPPPLSCEVNRAPTPLVEQPGQPIAVRISISGTATQILLNGAAAQANTSILLAPSSANDLYVAQVTVSNAQRQASCFFSTQVPRCTHRVESVVYSTATGKNLLRTRTSFTAPVAWLTVDGQEMAVPPTAMEVLRENSNIAYVEGSRLSQAMVESSFGDVAQCQASYVQPIPTAIAYKAEAVVWFLEGSPAVDDPVTSVGNPGLLRPYEARLQYGRPLRADLFLWDDFAPAVARNDGQCSPNEVMVGKRSNSDPVVFYRSVVCRKLRGAFTLEPASSVTVDWNYVGQGNLAACPAGQVVHGIIFSSPFQRFTIQCGEIRQR